jgi:hypothetical protein
MILFLTCVPRPHEEQIVQAQNALDSPKKHDAMVGICEKEVRNHTLIDRKKLTPLTEGCAVTDRGHDRSCDQRANAGDLPDPLAGWIGRTICSTSAFIAMICCSRSLHHSKVG